MNKIEYLTELMKNDVELINIAEKDVEAMELKLIVELKNAEEKCDAYAEMYEDDEGLVMSAYIEYEQIRSPLTELEFALNDLKINLLDHYELLLIEKKALSDELHNALRASRYNIVKLDETVNLIKGVLI